MKKVFRRPAALALVGVATVSFAVFIVASATAATKHKTASVDVCVLLPDTKSSVRWVQFDKPAMAAAFKSGRRQGVDHERPERPAQAEGAGAGLHRSGREGRRRDGPRQRLRRVDREALHLEGRQGDRLRPPGDRRHGIGLRDLRRQGGGRRPGHRRHPSDEGERDLQGRHASPSCGAARPTRTRTGSSRATSPSSTRSSRTHAIKRGPQQFVPDWDANNAATIFNQMLVKTSNHIQGVLAANDNIAGAVVADLKAKGLKPLPLSGQDASVQGVQNIISGWQTGTVYKYVPPRRRLPQMLRSRSSRARSPRRTGPGRTASIRSRPMRCR